MKRLFLWIKRNYVNINFAVGISATFAALMFHQMGDIHWIGSEEASKINELMRWILYYCLVQHTVVLLVDLYKAVIKKQYKEKLFCVSEDCFPFFLVLTALLGFYYNIYLGRGVFLMSAILTLFMTVSRAIRDKHREAKEKSQSIDKTQ